MGFIDSAKVVFSWGVKGVELLFIAVSLVAITDCKSDWIAFKSVNFSFNVASDGFFFSSASVLLISFSTEVNNFLSSAWSCFNFSEDEIEPFALIFSTLSL